MGVDDFDFRVGCGAHGCIMRIDPTGQGVGMCRCLPREMLPDDRVRLRRQIAALRDRLAEVERLRDEARAALAQARREGVAARCLADIAALPLAAPDPEVKP